MMLVSFKTVAQRVSLVEQELFILQVAYEFTSVFLWDSCCPNLFCIIFCEYLFVFLPLFCYCIFVGNWLRFTASDYPLGLISYLSFSINMQVVANILSLVISRLLSKLFQFE